MNPLSETVNKIVSGLRSIGYGEPFLEENYKFPDWFSPNAEECSVAAAAFGQTPVSYDSACIGVATSNGLHGASLVNKCRALGAPVLLEIDKSEIREWAVSRFPDKHGLVETYATNRIDEMFVARAPEWRRESLLRSKNAGAYHWNQQLSLFVGLVPELEQHIQWKLDPLLRETIGIAQRAYREESGRDPKEAQLFQLVFWIITAKVFYDRRVGGFFKLTGEADELLAAVARHYRVSTPRLLTQRSRQIAADLIWTNFDFRNLSVEVLAQIWSKTLVDEQTRRDLSVHRTSRQIVRYIVERMPFIDSDDQRIVLEPCSGSAVFLIGAMNALRLRLFGADAEERHRYFVNHLAGIEKDSFAVEISKLALTLADFPKPNGWDVAEGDVFDDAFSAPYFKRAGVVLCNPPFADFTPEERALYNPHYIHKPAAVLDQVLKYMHPQGVLGFVLPRIFVDGRGSYAELRKRIAERFATIEVTILPDRAFEEADSEIALLVAFDPIPHRTSRVVNRKVADTATAWVAFETAHEVSTEHVADLTAENAEETLLVPELPDVWDFLLSFPTLKSVADIRRGLEFKKPLKEYRSEFVRSEPSDGFALGVAPQTKFDVFQVPQLAYLSVRKEDQRVSAWKLPWHRPKAILNKAARSRGHWRIAAFPDTQGLVCYQTFLGVWPITQDFDEWTLAAVLNSPVANAFVATREGKVDITVETLERVPIPVFTAAQRKSLQSLIGEYQRVTSGSLFTLHTEADAETLLKAIDAAVLAGYRMPPRIERQLLDFFRGEQRPVSHRFSDYFPSDFGMFFSLSEYLAPNFESASVGNLLKRMREIPHA